ncbi:hypothetical protein T09_3235 [Trichinella sp. T9]|nr:hypothetical protein T09_3235 [Trichinella sp. T9]
MVERLSFHLIGWWLLIPDSNCACCCQKMSLHKLFN